MKNLRSGILTFLIFTLFIQLKAQDSLQYYYGKASEAYRQNNLKEFLDNTKQCYRIRPNSYTIQYNLACAYSLSKDSISALKLLHRMADVGFAPDIVSDSDFDFIRNSPGYAKLLKQFDTNKAPVINSELAFEIPEKDVIPEGICYDPVDKAFYLGSIFKSKILKIDSNGVITDFIKEKEHGFVTVLGMAVDAKRRILWAVSSYDYYHKNIPKEKLGISGIYKINIKDGSIINHYALDQTEHHLLNDVTIAENGNVYISDSHVPAVYVVDEKTDAIKKIVDLPTGCYPNGITISPDQKRIFVATSFEIYIVNLIDNSISTLKHPENILTSNNDGLYFYKNSLIGVQSFMGRITKFNLNNEQNSVESLTILEANNPLFDSPTTGTIVGNRFYLLANAQFNKINNEGKIAAINEINTTKILNIRIANE